MNRNAFGSTDTILNPGVLLRVARTSRSVRALILRASDKRARMGTTGVVAVGAGLFGQKSQNSVLACVMLTFVALTSSLSVTASTYKLRSPAPAS
jgi:hypothetical protein